MDLYITRECELFWGGKYLFMLEIFTYFMNRLLENTKHIYVCIEY